MKGSGEVARAPSHAGGTATVHCILGFSKPTDIEWEVVGVDEVAIGTVTFESLYQGPNLVTVKCAVKKGLQKTWRRERLGGSVG